MQHSVTSSTRQPSVDFIKRLLDISAIVLAWYFICDELSDTSIFWISPIIVMVSFQLLASLGSAYESQRNAQLGQQLTSVLTTLLLSFCVLAISAYSSHRLHAQVPRRFLFEWALASALLLCAWRIGYRAILVQLYRFGLNTRTAAVVGTSKTAEQLIEGLRRHASMGIHVVGRYHHTASTQAANALDHGLEAMLVSARRGDFDVIYLALPMYEREVLQYLVGELADSACTVYLVPDVSTFDLLDTRSHTIDGLPVIGIYDTSLSQYDEYQKRLLDVAFSTLALVMLLPVLVTLALAVKLTSPGPVFFKQRRYGLNGRAILVWKFRSMTTLDDGAEVRQAQRNDARLTPIGGFLRGSSLDELPQFINVLLGSMSVVGPRPHAVAHNEAYRKLIPGYMLRHQVKPGITGWAQVNGWRGETDTLDKMQARIDYDIDYIRRWSLWFDLKIILLTVFGRKASSNAF